MRKSVVPALVEAGFDVTVAATGDEALAILDGERAFDFLFSDVVMPGLTSGIKLAAEAKRRFPQMEIVLATGYSHERIDVPGVQLLGKPYEVNKAVALLTRQRK